MPDSTNLFFEREYLRSAGAVSFRVSGFYLEFDFSPERCSFRRFVPQELWVKVYSTLFWQLRRGLIRNAVSIFPFVCYGSLQSLRFRHLTVSRIVFRLQQFFSWISRGRLDLVRHQNESTRSPMLAANRGGFVLASPRLVQFYSSVLAPLFEISSLKWWAIVCSHPLRAYVNLD